VVRDAECARPVLLHSHCAIIHLHHFLVQLAESATVLGWQHVQCTVCQWCLVPASRRDRHRGS
jgi:hypothetical protein